MKKTLPGALSWITEPAYVIIVEFRIEWDTFNYLDEMYLGDKVVNAFCFAPCWERGPPSTRGKILNKVF